MKPNHSRLKRAGADAPASLSTHAFSYIHSAFSPDIGRTVAGLSPHINEEPLAISWLSGPKNLQVYVDYGVAGVEMM